MTKPAFLPFTGDADADRLLADDPLALLIGFALDQQVTVQKAFSGPAELKRRLGHLDAARIAAMDPVELDDGLPRAAGAPSLPGLDGRQGPGPVRGHRDRLRQRRRRGSGRDATDGRDLEARLRGLPGFGEMKTKSVIAVLGNRFGVRPPGYDDVAPTWPTLGDVDSGRGARDVPGGQARQEGGAIARPRGSRGASPAAAVSTGRTTQRPGRQGRQRRPAPSGRLATASARYHRPHQADEADAAPPVAQVRPPGTPSRRARGRTDGRASSRRSSMARSRRRVASPRRKRASGDRSSSTPDPTG